MRTAKVIFVIGLILAVALPAAAQSNRTVHRASSNGGTGMMFMRIGDQLDPQEFNASMFLTYMAFSKLPLNPRRRANGPYIDDPRGDAELWHALTFNYGINHIVEVGLQVPLVYISDMREAGVGRMGIDVRALILNVDRMGLGISATVWGNGPSPQEDITSHEINAGGELNFMLSGASATNYFGMAGLDKWLLEPMRAYATMGWGYEDYLRFPKFNPMPYGSTPLTSRDPLDPEFVGTEVMYGALGLEFQVYDGLFIGSEIHARQWPDYHNDNNFLFVIPEITYTHSDQLTVGLAFGITAFRELYDDQPEWQVTGGFTYHFPEFVKSPVVPEGAPPQPVDLIDVFTPSRKPIPTETEGEEAPVPPGGDDSDIPTEPVD